MDEAIYADKVYVMDSGTVQMQGTPKEVFSQVDKLQELRLDVPQVTLLAESLKEAGVALPDGIITEDELVAELRKLKDKE